MMYRDKPVVNKVLSWRDKKKRKKNFSEMPSCHQAQQIFKNEFTDISNGSNGKLKFPELRLKYRLYSSNLPQYICTCIYHDNVECFKLNIDGIDPIYSHDLPNM